MMLYETEDLVVPTTAVRAAVSWHGRRGAALSALHRHVDSAVRTLIGRHLERPASVGTFDK